MHPRCTKLALALLLASSPFAAKALEGDVTIYGTLLPLLDNARVTGPTGAGLSPATGGATLVPAASYTGAGVPQRFRVSSGTSNIGFKGGLDVLGEDLQVFFQLESAVSPDGDAPNAWASRNSAVGVKGSFGRVFLGNWDTPYKYPLLIIGALRGLNPFDNTITANPGFNVPGTITAGGRVAGKADASFNRRQGNSFQYWTPVLSGFSARLAAAANETKTTATATSPSISPELYSALLTWSGGPVMVHYGYERHQDYFGLAQLGGSAGATATNRSSTDEGHEVVVQVKLPTDTRIAAAGEQLSYRTTDQTAGAVDRYTRLACWAIVQQRLGPHAAWLSFGHADAGECRLRGGGHCTAKGLGATNWAVGYAYALTKSADVYAAYYETQNDHSASYALLPSPGTVAPGGDTRGFGVGILYTFAATAKLGAPAGTP
jgi:predicted porin